MHVESRVEPRVSAPESERSARTRPSLRALLHGWVVIFGALSIAVSIALIVTTSLLQQATDAVMRDVTSMNLASRLEVELLKQQRYLTIVVHAPTPEAARAYEEAAGAVGVLVAEGGRQARSGREAVLWRQVAEDVSTYLAYLEERDLGDPGLLGRTRVPLERAVSALDELRALGEARVADAHRAADRLDNLSTAAGAAAAVLLLVGLVAVLIGARRYVVRPIVTLRDGIRRFRAGETDVRMDDPGTVEMIEVTDAFEDLVGALARSRDAQLAFLAGVAHDLRNPLSGLRMALHVVASETSEVRRERTIALMDRQIDRLARMIDDLLDATRIEAGRLELQLGSFDVREAARDIVRLYEPTAPRHEIVLHVPDEPVRIVADSLRVEQVISNLVSNAVKYSPDGGRVDVLVAGEEDGVAIEVRDQGIGIPRAQIAELFLPFRRRAREVAPGAGLGLSVVRHIVRAHGGSIDVTSAPGRGSTFVVHLPVEPVGADRAAEN